jgi:hypothetical protein
MSAEETGKGSKGGEFAPDAAFIQPATMQMIRESANGEKIQNGKFIPIFQNIFPGKFCEEFTKLKKIDSISVKSIVGKSFLYF